MFMRRALEIGKLVGYAAEGVIAACVAVETCKKILTERRKRKANKTEEQTDQKVALATN